MAEDSKKSNRFRQYIAALIVNIGGFMVGTGLGWSASATEIISANIVKLDDSGKSWISSSFTLGAALVMFPIAYLSDKFGRKIIMLSFAPPLVVGWMILAFSKSVGLFIVGRVITGFCSAVYCVMSPLYTGEIADTETRGRLGVFFQLLLVVGILLSLSLGISDSVMVMSLVSGLIPIVFCICLLFLPDTPLYFLLHDDEESAEKSLQWLRGKHHDIDEELEMISESAELTKARKTTFFDSFKSKAARKALLISIVLMICQQLSGINAIIFYNVFIFKESGSTLDPIYASMIVGVVQVFASLIAAAVVDRFGRKILLLISHIAMGICLVIIGAYFTILARDKEEAKSWGPVPLVITCLYILAFALGSGPIPWAMLGELFPNEIKGAASSISSFVNWLLAFIVTQTFAYMISGMGPKWTFFTYAIICFLASVFIFFVVFETKGKTLDEIQALMAGDNQDGDKKN